MTRINIIMGDWSDDGHGKTSMVCIESNLSQEDIEAAYAKGVEIIGVDITKLCDEYEDHNISPKDVAKYEAAGFDTDFIEHDVDYDDVPTKYWLDTDLFFDLWLFTVKTGNPDFTYRDGVDGEIKIGGYGLFN